MTIWENPTSLQISQCWHLFNCFLFFSKPCMQKYIMSLSCYFAEHPLYYSTNRKHGDFKLVCMYSHKACHLNGNQTWYFSLNVYTRPDEVLHTHQREWLKHPLDNVCWVETNTKCHTSIASLAFIVSLEREHGHRFFYCWNWGKTEIFLYTFFFPPFVKSSFKESWALRYHTSTASSIALSPW